MPLFVILGHDGPDALAKRPVVRPRHLDHLRPLSEAGRVVVAGPLFGDDGKTPRGSLIVLEAPSLDEARALAARDPYVVDGVFARHEVMPFARVFPESTGS
ncbi:MAG: YciI family protein [Deltaproteobacteria bacterium]|nr:YciI family protein [Deltaproteobacteria bacterium]